MSCVAAAEQAAAPESTALGEAVATYLYKLMAYKDEYEVARLHLQEQFRGWVRGQHPRAKARDMPQPPVLRTLGMKRKLAVPPAIALPAFTALRERAACAGRGLIPSAEPRSDESNGNLSRSTSPSWSAWRAPSALRTLPPR